MSHIPKKHLSVSEVFNRLSRDYDALNSMLSFGVDIRWRSRLIAALSKENPHKILDVATGTGSLPIGIAQSMNAKVVGLDISEKMLEIANKKVKKADLEKSVSFVLGDAENLSFPDQHFDAVTLSFAVRNFEQRRRALQDIHRVLKPGGALFVLELSKPRYFPLKQLVQLYFKIVFPILSRLISKNSTHFKYLLESLQNFPSQDMFVKELHAVRFKTVSTRVFGLGLVTLYKAYA